MAKKKTNQTIRSVEISSDILEALQELDGGGVTDLADRLSHSKSTIHNHLATLEQEQLIVRENNQYRLSLRFLDMAEHVRDQFGNFEVIRNELDSLADETGEVAQFGIEEHGYVRYLYKAKSDRGVDTASSIGQSQSLHSTALGKSILAHESEDRINEIIDMRGMPEYTDYTITSREELFEELKRVQEQGYAIDDEENVAGLCCIAAPVLTGQDQVLGAVSVSGPKRRFNGERLETELPDKVQSAANVIELNSKFS